MIGFNRKDSKRNICMLNGAFRKKGYDWWWHNFTAVNDETGEERPFFIEFFLCNPALGGQEPVFGQLPANKTQGIYPSYLMVKAGTWGEKPCQLHRFFGWNDVLISNGKFYQVEAGGCLANDNLLKGKIEITAEEAQKHPEWMCDSGTMEWSLSLDKQVAFNVGYGASTLFRLLKAFEMYWHAEGMKTLFNGYVIYNGQRYTVSPERSFGYADKNWGSDFTSPWVWLSSCCMRSRLTGKQLENSVFDIGGGRPVVFGVALERKLLGAFWYEGRPYEFNFSKFWTGCKTEFSSEETETDIVWHVRQETHRAVMETDISCPKKEMLLVNYESPDGQKRHNRLWNGGGGQGSIRLYAKKKGQLQLIDDLEVSHVGCEYGEYGAPAE